MDNEQDELQDIEPSSIITPDDWENQLRDWEQMLIDEEIARLEDEKAERDNNGNMEDVNAQSTFCDKDTNFCFKIELPSNSAAKNGSSTNNYATFTLTAPSTIGWTAIGIGESMNGAYMMIAWPNSDGTITISQRKSTSYYPESTKNQDDLILHPSSNIKNGQMTAVIQRALSVQGSTLTTSSAGQSFIWAVSNINPKSKTENADLEKHNSKGQEKIVLQKATANNNNNNNNGGTIITLASKSGLTKTQKLVIAHGSFMFLAWMVAVPSAIFIARFGRVTFASSWFHLHWGIQVFGTMIFAIIGYTIIRIQNFSWGSKYSNSHVIIGNIIFWGIFGQLLIGIIHHKLFKADRGYIPWWTKLHWWVGRALFILALFQIVLGFKIYGVSTGIYIAYFIYIGIVLLAFFAGSIRLMLKNKSKH